MSLSRTGNNLYIVCTSGTRPSSPSAGTMIYETDTNLVLLYNASAWVTITPVSAVINTLERVNQTTYSDAATPGPEVSIQTGTKAMVTVGARIQGSASTTQASASYSVSGATTLAADESWSVRSTGTVSTYEIISRTYYFSNLTAGVNTFHMLYRGDAGNRDFSMRSIHVVGIP